jgi:anti-sigma regulatory factor (Ser/Thr protein kinase)
MEDLSLHILDIAENSIRAGATFIEIEIEVDTAADKVTIAIRDNGKGMTETEIKRATDPFYSSKTTRRIGLGIPLLMESASQANGSVRLESEPGKGTVVTAWFELSHIDRRPFGNITETIITLIAGNPDVNFSYTSTIDGTKFTIATDEIKKSIRDVPINSPQVLNFIRKALIEYEKSLP